MTVTVELRSPLADVFKARRLVLDLAEDSTVRDLVTQVGRMFETIPGHELLLRQAVASVDDRLLEPNDKLYHGWKIILYSPAITGG